MKKVLSFVLCLCMALGMSAFAVSAVDVSEIKDGAVIEFEKFAGEANKDLYVFENLQESRKPYGVAVMSDAVAENGTSLSGGGVLSLAERNGATSMTLTVPVSVTEPGWYDVTWYGTDGGENADYLSNYTVSLGDASFTVAGNTGDYFKPAKNVVVGDNADIAYYPIKRYHTRIFVAEDVEEMVITAGANTQGDASGTGVKLMIDAMVFAKHGAISASKDKTAVVEMENYIPDIRYTYQEGKTNSAAYLVEPKASGGAVMNMEERSGIMSVEFDFQVKIETDGWYVLNLVANHSNNGDTSVLHIKNGEDEWINNWEHSGYAGKELLYFGTDDAHRWYGMYDHTTAKYLEAGEYNLTASATYITTGADQGNYATKFIADCLTVAPDRTDVPAEGKRLELEDCVKLMVPRKSSIATNQETGEKFATDLGGATTGFTTTLVFKQSGYYNITFHGSPYLNNGLSKVNFYLDGNLVIDNDNNKRGASDGYDFAQWLPAWTFTENDVYVSAGAHTLSAEIITRDPDPTHNNECAWAGDYLEFTAAQIPTANDQQAAVLEMEDYVKYIKYTYGSSTNSASIKTEAKASGGRVLDMAEKSNITSVEFNMPVIVEKSGWYKVNLVSTNGDVKDTSVLRIHNGEEEWVNSWTHSGYAGTEKLFFGTEDDGQLYKWYPVYDHIVTKYIEAGEYTLTASAVAIENNPNATKFIADCLKIEPMNLTVPADGRFELEDLQYLFTPWKPGIVTAEGDSTVRAMWTYGGANVGAELSFNFPESGYYDISFFGTPFNNNGLSKINISIDGSLVMNNDETKGGEALGYDYKAYLPAYKFTKEFVYVSKGVHSVSIEAFVRKPDDPLNECAFGMDALVFDLIESEAILNVAQKKVDVTAYYGAPTSGDFIAVAYADGKMVGMSCFSEIDRTIFDAIIYYEGDVAPDTVKVFVWEDIYGLIPMEEPKIITVK